LSGYIGVFHRNNLIDDREKKDYSMESLAMIIASMDEQ
jgi:hypothetical protein